jgi:hypothetical protein
MLQVDVSLRELTRPLHHAAEQHPVGAAMADGTIPAEWWSQWCLGLLAIHAILDHHCVPVLRRSAELASDLRALPQTLMPPSALEYCAELDNRDAIDGAMYVFTGAHLMGGAVIERRLRDRLPCAHLLWSDRRQAIAEWSPLRARGELQAHADRGFRAVHEMMGDIVT